MQTMGRNSAARAALGLTVDGGIVLVEKLAALGMADDHVADVEFAQHSGRYFARIGTRGGFMQVLGAQPDVGDGIEQFADGSQGGEGRAEDDFRRVEPADFLEQIGDKRAGLGLRFIHFPIAGDDFFAVDHKSGGLNWEGLRRP